MLSDAVQVRPPAFSDTGWLDETIEPDVALRANMPTETEVRDAMAKLNASLQDMVRARIAGGSGWTVEDADYNLVELDRGELILRGSLIISRPD